MGSSDTTVGIIGGGMSGICLAAALKRAGIEDFVIYEKADALGGTWHHNTYPGLACDVPSHIYSFSFEPNPGWSELYSSGSEIKTYFQNCAEKYGVVPHVRFATHVERVEYDDHDGAWDVRFADGTSARHRFVVNAASVFFAPQFPDFAIDHPFQGATWHSSQWNHDYDLRGKRVAVIGSAASAVQIVPRIAREVAQLYVYQRTPNWVIPRENRRYDAETRQRFQVDPAALRRHRAALYKTSLGALRAFRNDQRMLGALKYLGLKNIRQSIKDETLVRALTPTFEPGCKRLLVSDDYFPALAAPHVELMSEAVRRLTATGVVSSSGAEREVDAVIFCTGYHLPYYNQGPGPFEVTGRGGVTLRETMGGRLESYRGVAVPGFPNLFLINGPNGLVGYSSLIATAEIHSHYIVERIGDALRQGAKAIEVRPEVNRAYNDAMQEELGTMTWATSCPSYYTDDSGRVVTFYPGTIGRMRREFRTLGLEDYDVDYPSESIRHERYTRENTS